MSKTTGKTMTVIMGVSFVWFTTHFGGGFASGAQLFSYFGRFGALALLMPVLAMLYNAVFFSYALHFAKKHDVYDYRSYNNAFYGKFAPIFSNLFEIIYLVTMCVAPAVAFATGGATLSDVTGIPYMICTIIIGVFIFVIAIYGTSLVRKVSSVLSVVIIAGLMFVYIPNIAVGFGKITEAVQASSFDGITFRSALYSAFLYGSFQLINIAVFIQHAESFEQPSDAKKSMGIGFVINSLMMVMVSLGLLSVSQNPEIGQQSVPTLFMVRNGVGASFMTPIISILIILGAVTTAVNMVAAMVKRVTAAIEKGKTDPKKKSSGKPNMTMIIVALICCLIDFGIAQFGLLTLVKKAYSLLAYLEIPVILVPYLIHMIYTKFGTKEVGK